MRTCVRVGRPYRPVRELEGHLARGELDFALAVLRGVAGERRRPLELELALRFLPLIAIQRPEEFDRWALRWLERWCGERGAIASVDDAVELVAGLAEMPIDPAAGMSRARLVTGDPPARAPEV
jgi:hypothetical protein